MAELPGEPPPHIMGRTGDVRPVPDPTWLTQQATEAAKQEMRREIACAREILEERLEGMDKAVNLIERWREGLPGQLHEAMTQAAAILDERFKTLQERFNTVDQKFEAVAGRFKERDVRDEHVATAAQEALATALLAAKETTRTALQAIAGQFAERDVRTDQAATAAKEAVATALQAAKEAVGAALQAAKEAVAAQNTASTNAILKSETSTDKRIDETVRLLNSTTSGLEARITIITEQSKNTMTRQEVEQLFRSVLDKLDGPTGLAMRLESYVSRGLGRGEQESRATQANQWGIGAVLGGMALLVAIIALAVKMH